MNLLDELRELGVSVDEGVKRLGGNAAIYKKMLGTFLKMMKTYSFEPDYDNEAYDDIGKKSAIKSKYLEGSNVNVATEMVNLIIAQRAYELCSKAITTSDTMMEQANNLKR